MGPADNREAIEEIEARYLQAPYRIRPDDFLPWERPHHQNCRCILIPSIEPTRKPTMNQSASVMLFEENGVRPVRVEYDPDNAGNNKGAMHTHFFKCVDPEVEKGDLVIIQTSTRQGFTIAKVVAIGYADVPVDFEDQTNWQWVGGKFDVGGFKDILETEKKLIGLVAEANANMMRAKLQEAMGLSKVSFKDVFIKAPTALASPHGAAPAAAPAEEDPEAPTGKGMA